MTRQEYYERVERAIKISTKIPMCMEVWDNGWWHLNLYDKEVPVNAEYRLKGDIGNYCFSISEKAFDKYYLPCIDYKSKADVEYREGDIELTVSNLKYVILDVFRKEFL